MNPSNIRVECEGDKRGREGVYFLVKRVSEGEMTERGREMVHRLIEVPFER